MVTDVDERPEGGVAELIADPAGQDVPEALEEDVQVVTHVMVVQTGNLNTVGNKTLKQNILRQVSAHEHWYFDLTSECMK